jgi:diadenosine tetraphosphate (Ap4A) HIT family hydrolase
MMSEAFQKLKEFLTTGMRMAHIYQPVMIRRLLESKGVSSTREIAKSLLAEDRAQIEYYELITKRMVGKVLTKKRGITSKEGNDYILNGFEKLSAAEIEELVGICKQKTESYLSARSDPWSHRRSSNGYVSGTIRYEVLKRAKSRCELCGISYEVKALEVDHIVPRSRGGTDDITNFQALCYSCNAAKGNRDNADFRNVTNEYEKRKDGCLFCEIDPERIIGEDELSYMIRDAFPVTELHTLVIPKRHVETFFDLYQPERNSIFRLLDIAKVEIQNLDSNVTGFNIGMNSGVSAGQTIDHCHIHLIPRRDGDVADPRGGVRGVIPEKQKYKL